MSKTRLSLRAILLAAAPISSAASIPAELLFARDESCAVEGYTPCKGSGIPSNFCCPDKTSCLVLAGDTTVMCCPDGKDCLKVNPITCDVSQQDASKNPKAPLKTTALKSELPKCGSNCCPFGFSCADDGACTRDADQSKAPAGSKLGATASSSAPASSKTPTATSSPGTATSTSQPATTSDSSSASTSSTTSISPKKAANSSTVSIVGGVVGGIAALVVLGVLAWVLFGRRRLNKRNRQDPQTSQLNRSTSSFGDIIANPVVISAPKAQSDASAYRTDFIRKSPAQTTSTAPFFDPRYGRPASRSTMGDASDMASTPATAGGGVAPIRGMRPDSRGNNYGRSRSPNRSVVGVMAGRSTSRAAYGQRHAPPKTPRAQREPSMEINVFADPDTVAGSSRRGSFAASVHTTFTALMERADLGGMSRGESFVPGSALSTPASRRR